jgi:type IV pilus assembly protein PilC
MRYAYRARDAQGRRVQGQVEAESWHQALERLRGQGVYPVTLRPPSPFTGTVESLLQVHLIPSRLSLRQAAILSRQLGSAMEAGIPILDALRAVTGSAQGTVVRSLALRVSQRLERGSTLVQAFFPEATLLPAGFLPFLQAGEVGGTLDQVLLRLADTYEQQETFQGKLRSALAYPTVVVVAAVGAVLFLLWAVVPNFAYLYGSLHASLPGMTRWLLAVSQNLRTHTWQWAGVVAGVVAVLFGLRRVRVIRGWTEELWRRLPVLGPLAHLGGLARFCRSLASMLRAGVPILEALEVSSGLLAFSVDRRVVQAAAGRVRQGQSLAEAIAGEDTRPPRFPPLLLEFVRTGEATGRLEDMLERAAGFYERDVELTSSRLSSLLEPMLVAVLGAVVATIMGSVLLPMYSLFPSVP